MHCLNTRIKQQTHELQIVNLRSEQAVGQPMGILHFNGECKICFSSYWQDGPSAFPDGLKLKPATCDCGSL